jgi:hypothetical protein
MRQGFSEQGRPSTRARRTEPALPGATAPTLPDMAQPQRLYAPKQPLRQQTRPIRRALWLLALLGVCLEILWLAIYPLLAAAASAGDAARQALANVAPWLPGLSWLSAWPWLVQWLAREPLFHIATTPASSGPMGGAGAANLLFLLLGISFLLSLIAGRIGRTIMRERLTAANIRSLLVLILFFTACFGISLLFIPGIMSQDMLLYGLYGRLVTVYHANPYTAALSLYQHDLLRQGLSGSIANTPPGPVWMDICIVVAQLSGASVANVIIGFRVLGLAAHLANAGLIWLILAKQKPELRASATILYAWNPLVLLLAASGMHLDIVLILFILLAIFTFQRKSFMLGWVFLIMAALINLLALLFLPLFLRVMAKEARVRRPGARLLWWLGIIVVTALVVVLAYLPYWQGWGITGILANARHVFLQNNSAHSLDAALLNLPIHLPAALLWLAMPHHWTLLAAIAVGCLLLLGVWLTDTVHLAILFSAWIALAMFALLPLYWPWYALLPLALALCATSRRTLLLAVLLALSALLSLYALLWQPAWPGLALLSVGLPVLIWGWTLFFSATWEMLHSAAQPAPAGAANSRPPRRGLSRPSRSGK